MTGSYGRFIPIVFIIILLFSIADILTTYFNLNTIRSDESLVDHTIVIREELRSMLVNLIEAESTQRGFLITSDNKYLTLYKQSIPDIMQHINRLKTLTQDNIVQQKHILSLEQAVKNRLKFLQQGINQKNDDANGQMDPYIEEGQTAMLNVRGIITNMDQAEQTLLTKRRQEVDRSYQSIYVSSAIAGILNLSFVFLALYLIWREIQRRNALEQSKDDFISMASHELKTPITSLKVYTSLASKKLDKTRNSKARQYLNRIDEQTTRLATLIRDMLDISRIQTGKMRIEKEPFQLDTLIDETVEAIQETTNKHKMVIHPGIKRKVNGDRYRIYQVLVNLLTNAIKYSPDGGTIIITTDQTPTGALVSVEDSGIGVPPQFRKKIFDRLYQVTRAKGKNYPGLGIGLFISSQIVKMHGGRIWVEGKRGKGSIFYFTINNDEAH